MAHKRATPTPPADKVRMPRARLVLTIEYNADSPVPSDRDLEELLDKAKELGHVTSAEMELLEPLKRDLLKEI